MVGRSSCSPIIRRRAGTRCWRSSTGDLCRSSCRPGPARRCGSDSYSEARSERTGGCDMTDRLRFGIFMAPFHQAGENPTLALERDLDLIAHLDRLGWDEAWIGEHHSAGTEIIASPEI